ncbi:hypothetical protein EKH55_1732 [Sinorhizobium alkalisoli]|nr:hypothetical protein EKH55_1732 [Sinorhizobium alkalisoli]
MPRYSYGFPAKINRKASRAEPLCALPHFRRLRSSQAMNGPFMRS